eukprot:6440232-Pyramimonas_sp.AAC.1
MFKEAPRSLQDGPKWPNSCPRRPRIGPNPSKTWRTSMVCDFSVVRFRWPSKASILFQDNPSVQEGTERDPR